MESWVSEYYADIDNMRMGPYLDWHTPGVRVQFANNPAAEGAEEVRGAIGHFWDSIAGLKHNFVNVWHNPDGWTVVEAHIDYHRKDGQTVTLPCVTSLHRPADKIDEVRIFIDVAPVFAPSAEPAVAS